MDKRLATKQVKFIDNLLIKVVLFDCDKVEFQF